MKRLDNETQKDYKIRRANAQKQIKTRLMGRWFWKSKYVVLINKLLDKNYKRPASAQSNGTYIKPIKKVDPSFTKELRLKRDYDKHLQQKYSA